MTTPVYIGNDQGYYGTKVVSRTNGKFYKMFIRNMVVPNRVGEITYNNDSHNIMYREHEGDREWFCGKLAIEQSGDDELFDSHRRRLFSPTWFREQEYLIMFRVSTGLMLQGNQEPVVSVALPTDSYIDYKDELKKRLVGKHSFEVKQGNLPWRKIEFEIKQENLFVISQPMATLFHIALDRDGRLLNEDLFIQKVSINDLGFGTSDVETLHGETIIKRQSFTSRHAMLNVYQLLSKRLLEFTENVDSDGNGKEYPIWSLPRIVNSGEISFKGKVHDVSNLIQASIKEVGEALIDEVWNRLDYGDDITFIILTGGASIPFKPFYRERFGEKLIFAEDYGIEAQFANGFGLCKFAQSKANNTNSKGIIEAAAAIHQEFNVPEKVGEPTANKKSVQRIKNK
ncbi:ParM/StbA family protein [Hazenella sp. IB182357]|uniref:ParM/StbA family protein n=1 Tax=Polycladospora coralii TaxID=2771432 RepID=A0A926RTQ3_9BACL|nr:ParM/StbA family protein [Polycladospora coralii]MBD1371983.1 ParM/StbA family protein [Polycladospora coralii]MBS7530489.1 ParM/StbA family protein [Polycladospora coralii]